MPGKISQRLLDIVNALPLESGMRVLEIGCGSGVAAREIANRIGPGKVLGLDQSKKAIDLAIRTSQAAIRRGNLEFMQVAIEDLDFNVGDTKYDIAFAIRVGALDGRHPGKEKRALEKITRALTPKGKLFIDGGNPLQELRLK